MRATERRSASSSRLAVLRHLAAALLIAALAAFLVQTAARPGLAAGMALDQPGMAGHSCDHTHADTGGTQAPLTAACGSAPSLDHDDCCHQPCTVVALLPPVLSGGDAPRAEGPSDLWLDRPGRSPAAILRPPRIRAVA